MEKLKLKIVALGLGDEVSEGNRLIADRAQSSRSLDYLPAVLAQVTRLKRDKKGETRKAVSKTHNRPEVEQSHAQNSRAENQNKIMFSHLTLAHAPTLRQTDPETQLKNSVEVCR